ncbi:MAG: hypothetical protein IT210_18230 [Armatimonadetes bacterium]|nr:hypothetical protein [Armatimonadota bacterium]
MIVLASWAKESPGAWEKWANHIKLRIDLEGFGAGPAKTRLRAPALKDLQPERVFSPAEEIPVEPGQGWFLIAE